MFYFIYHLFSMLKVRPEILFLISVILGFKLQAQTTSIIKSPFNPKIVQKGGVFFALPKNILKVEVVMKIIEKRRGIYSPFTNKYFNVSDYIKADSREHFLKEVRIISSTMPDEKQVYFLSTDKTKGISIQTDERGIIRSLNANSSYDAKTKSFLPVESKSSSETIALNSLIQPRFSYKADTVINRELTKDSTVIEKRYISKRLVEKSMEDYARETFDKLQEIKKRRFDFLSDPSDLNLDGEGLQLLLNELEKMEKSLLETFFGTTTSYEKVVTFDFEPSKEPDQPLFNFVRDRGILFNYKDFRGIETVKLEIQPLQSVLQPVLAVTSFIRKKNKLNHIPYRVPLMVRARIIQDETVFYDGILSLAQHGDVAFLPVRNLSKVRLIYDPATGYLLSADFAR